MKWYLTFAVLLIFQGMSEAQHKISFPSSDSITITADVYGQDKGLPYILLFHQANFSRGEYLETAPKLQKLGYNCIAVDLRSGNEVNYIQNETAAAAKAKNLPTEYTDAEKDILAAINYTRKITSQKIILLGSSYSASLVLKVARNNPSVKAVIAFSPGEYFNNFQLKKEISGLDKPLFIASTKKENPSIKQMVSGINESYITWFVPSKTNGIHGSRALWSTSPENETCWMQLLMFFKALKK
jgi:dienelactone hydrolase